jgi:hypothetical protein
MGTPVFSCVASEGRYGLAQIIRSLAAKQRGVIVISHSAKLLGMLHGNELKIEDGSVVGIPV